MNHERFLVRTSGGPTPGTRIVTTEDWVWPFPEVLTIPDVPGRYCKVTESRLPPQPSGSHVIRGVAYVWHPKGGTE